MPTVASTSTNEAQPEYTWSIESGQLGGITSAAELDFDWKAAGLPEPLPERVGRK